MDCYSPAPTGFLKQLDGNSLAINTSHGSHAEWSRGLGVQLAELPVSPGYYLAWLKVEKHGRVHLVLLPRFGGFADSALHFRYAPTSKRG